MSGNDATLQVKVMAAQALLTMAQLNEAMRLIGDNAKKTSESAGEAIKDNTQKNEAMFERMKNVGRRTADSLKEDFKALFALNSIAGSLKLSEQFRGVVADSRDLGDIIAKIGPKFGVAANEFSRFKSTLVRGLGDIGLGADAAARALEGLSDTGVTDEKAVLPYLQAGGELASIGRERGGESGVTGNLARILDMQGKNQNDRTALNDLTHSLTRTIGGTGMKASQAQDAYREFYAGMDPDQRKRVGLGAAEQYATARATSPQGAEFLSQYLKKSKEERSGIDAQLGANVFNKDMTINTKALAQIASDIKGRGVSTRLGAATMVGEDMADSLVKLIESSGKLDDAFARTAAASDDTKKKYQESMTMLEGFKGSFSKLTGGFEHLLNAIGLGGMSPMEGVRRFMAHGASGEGASSYGAAGATVAGAAGLAALLAGGGLKTLMKFGGKAMGVAGGAMAADKMMSGDVQPVYVVNAADIRGDSISDAAKTAAGAAGGAEAAGVGIGGMAAGGLIAMIGTAIAGTYLLQKEAHKKDSQFFDSGPIPSAIKDLVNLFKGVAPDFSKPNPLAAQPTAAQKVIIHFPPSMANQPYSPRGSAQ